METRGWEKAKSLIKKNTAAFSLKADLEQKSEGSEHLDNSTTGDGDKSHGQSPNKEEGTTMSREGETKLHMEEKTEYTHPREEGAETALTHDFASIATKWSTILLLLIQNLITLKEG